MNDQRIKSVPVRSCLGRRLQKVVPKRTWALGGGFPEMRKSSSQLSPSFLYPFLLWFSQAAQVLSNKHFHSSIHLACLLLLLCFSFCFVIITIMPKPYRHMPLEDIEEEEPLTGGGADEKLAWRPQKKNTIVERLDSISPHWQWFAHLILLSLSMTFFALSLCIKSAKHPIPTDGRLPETYCMFDTRLRDLA